MATNRGELRTDVRTELKKDPNGRIWSDATLNGYIDKAYLKVQKDGNFQWRENQANTTFSTVSGTQEYTLPTDLGKIQLIRFNGTNLLKTTKVQLKREQNTFVAWTPSQYYVFGANVWFDVIPNVVGTIDFDYVKRLAALSTDSTESAFDTDFDVAIVKYAAFLAWSSIDGKQWAASSKLQEYGIEIDSLISTYIFDDINDLTFGLQKRRFIRNDQVLDRLAR